MPEEGVEFVDHSKILSYEEIEKVVRVGAKLGIKKIRLTGGEPMVRKNIEELVRMLANIPNIEDISMTTNGIFLADKAKILKESGLTRVNISLDSLNPKIFKIITRRGDLSKVLEAIDNSIQAGLSPIKINTVLMKGLNENEIEDFLRFVYDRPINLRFIEYMPIGHNDETWKSYYLPLTRVWEKIKELDLPIEETNITGNGPAKSFQIKGGLGSVGFIHPVSSHFCANCNRLRLTAEGYFKPCLYWEEELFVRPHVDDELALENLYFRALELKPENHEMEKLLLNEEQTHTPTTRRMSQIGG